MPWTKKDIVTMAFSEIAMAGYVFDLTAEELQEALARLDMLMAEWSASGISVGYAQGGEESNLNDDSGLPLIAARAVVSNLAVDLAASKGKLLHPSTIRAANSGRRVLLSMSAAPPSQQFSSTMPYGAANRGRKYFPVPSTGPLSTNEAGGLDLE